MRARALLCTVLALAAPLLAAQERDAVVVVAHPGVPHTDAATVQRLYTGRSVEVDGMAVVVVHAAPGSAARARFMATVVKQDEERYAAYWTVRKHVGKGTPPRELRTAAEVADFVATTPGAIGYLSVADLRPGLNVVLRP